MQIQIQEPRTSGSIALFNLGFRPFFLFGALSALVLMLIWLIMLSTGQVTQDYYQLSYIWHGHEMLFGYSVAIIAGFLLTAVKNWTSQQTPHGSWLAIIFAVWVAGRIMPFTALPTVLIAAVDMLFLPLVILGIAIPIIRSGNHRNLLFIVILSVMTLANGLMHAQLLGYTENTLLQGMQLQLGLIILIIMILGGRVIPFFTERALGNFTTRKFTWLEYFTPAITVAWLGSHFSGYLQLAGVLAALAAASQFLRLYGWFHPRLLRNPLLWILQLAYLFIPLGFALYAASVFTGISPYLSTHAFAAGAIGSITIGMMARVSLGHTGRPLKLTNWVKVGFGFMILSGLIRCLLPLAPELYTVALHASATFWVIAWALFLIPYSPILLQPRLDGQYG